MLDIYCKIRYYHLQVQRRGKQHKSGGKQGNLHQWQAANIIRASLTFNLKQRRGVKMLQTGVMLLQTRLSASLTPKIHSCVPEMNDWMTVDIESKDHFKNGCSRCSLEHPLLVVDSYSLQEAFFFFSFSLLVQSHVLYKYNTDEFTWRHLLNGSNNHSHN